MQSIFNWYLPKLDNSVLVVDCPDYTLTVEPSSEENNMYYVHTEGLNRMFDQEEVIDFCDNASKITLLDFNSEEEKTVYQLVTIDK